MALAKGSPKWKCFADVFAMYRENEHPTSNQEWDKWVSECNKICNGYKNTEAHALALTLCLALSDLVEKEYKDGLQK